MTEQLGNPLLGKKKIDLAAQQMHGITTAPENFDLTHVTSRYGVIGCITVTPETANLILALEKMNFQDLTWCSDNRFATDNDVAISLVSRGLKVFASANMTLEEYYHAMDKALELNSAERFIIIDDGCDITQYILNNHPQFIEKVDLILEQTTCGVNELRKILAQNQIKCPCISINDADAKKHFDNYYGVRESFIHALLNAFPHLLAGKRLTVFGYGHVGSGVAKALSSLGTLIQVVEADALKLLRAKFDGFNVVSKEEAILNSDGFILATGCEHVINEQDFFKMKSGAFLCNIGHGNREFDYDYLNSHFEMTHINDNLDMYSIEDRHLYVISRGALANMIASFGNAPSVMDMTFILHFIAIESYYKNPQRYKTGQLNFISYEEQQNAVKYCYPEIYAKRYALTKEQCEYINHGAHKDDESPYSYHESLSSCLTPLRYYKEDVLDLNGLSSFYIKHDDMADHQNSGSKVRKIELLLKHLQQKGVQEVVMEGYVDSNSCASMAYYTPRYGIKLNIVMYGPNNISSINRVIMEKSKSYISYVGEYDKTKIENKIQEIVNTKNKQGIYIETIPAGLTCDETLEAGSQIIKEISEQIAKEKQKNISIFIPVGTGGTFYGAALGILRYMPSAKLIGLFVAHDQEYFLKGLQNTLRDKEVSSNMFPDTIQLYDCRGQGYGLYNNNDIQDAQQYAARHGIYLDPIYTLKAFSGMKRYLEKLSHEDLTAVFVHTGGKNIFYSSTMDSKAA